MSETFLNKTTLYFFFLLLIDFFANDRNVILVKLYYKSQSVAKSSSSFILTYCPWQVEIHDVIEQQNDLDFMNTLFDCFTLCILPKYFNNRYALIIFSLKWNHKWLAIINDFYMVCYKTFDISCFESLCLKTKGNQNKNILLKLSKEFIFYIFVIILHRTRTFI